MAKRVDRDFNEHHNYKQVFLRAAGLHVRNISGMKGGMVENSYI